MILRIYKNDNLVKIKNFNNMDNIFDYLANEYINNKIVFIEHIDRTIKIIYKNNNLGIIYV